MGYGIWDLGGSTFGTILSYSGAVTSTKYFEFLSIHMVSCFYFALLDCSLNMPSISIPAIVRLSLLCLMVDVVVLDIRFIKTAHSS